MKILKIINQIRRDFTAIFICEHCKHEKEGRGYDDEYFHQTVIPNMVCPKCNKKADQNYRPQQTKYSKDEVI